MRTIHPILVLPRALPLTLPLALLCCAASAHPAVSAAVSPVVGSQASPQASPQATPSPQPAAAQGSTVVRDPETGALRAPTPAEMQALRPQAPAALARQAQPNVVTGPQGELSVELGERGLVYAVVKRGVDGKLDHQCVDGADAASRILDQSAPALQGGSRHDHR